MSHLAVQWGPNKVKATACVLLPGAHVIFCLQTNEEGLLLGTGLA